MTTLKNKNEANANWYPVKANVKWMLFSLGQCYSEFT